MTVKEKGEGSNEEILTQKKEERCEEDTDKVEMVEREKSLKFQWKGTDWKEEVKREERATG